MGKDERPSEGQLSLGPGSAQALRPVRERRLLQRRLSGRGLPCGNEDLGPVLLADGAAHVAERREDRASAVHVPECLNEITGKQAGVAEVVLRLGRLHGQSPRGQCVRGCPEVHFGLRDQVLLEVDTTAVQVCPPEVCVLTGQRVDRGRECRERASGLPREHQQEGQLALDCAPGARCQVAPTQRVVTQSERRRAIPCLGLDIGQAGLDPGQELVVGSAVPGLVQQVTRSPHPPGVDGLDATMVEFLGREHPSIMA